MQEHHSRAALYIRYASKEDRQRQLLDLERRALEAGYKEFEIFEDRSSDDSRPAQNDLLNPFRNGKFTALVVWKIDRLDLHARSTEAFLELVAKLAEAGVRLISVGDSIDSHANAGMFAIAALRAVNDARITIKSERVSRALKLAHATGSPVGRPKECDDEKIAELRNEGLSLREIAAKTGHSPWAVQRSLRRKAKGPDLDL